MKALTIFVVGLANVMVRSGLQYFSMTMDALHKSLVPARVPQLVEMSELMVDVTRLNSFVLRHIHACRAVLSSPHFVEYVSEPIPYEMALAAHGALMSVSVTALREFLPLQARACLPDR
jgi:hypothetical protein